MINQRLPLVTETQDKKKGPSLKQVAAMLGVSKMTVSRALREGTSVDTTLRAKIREMAQQVGYRPNSRISQVMSAVRTSKVSDYKETLALVWTHPHTEKGSCFFEEIRSGADLQARQFGYKLDEFHMSDEGLNGRSLSRILQARGIRGVLIAPPGGGRNHPHIWLDWAKFCSVLIGRSFANGKIARVQPDHYSACVMAVRRLRRLRYRRIGLVLSRSFDQQTGHIVRSAFRSFHPLGFNQADKLTFTSDNPDSKAVAKWMEQAKPEVVIANFENGFPRPEHLVSRSGQPIGLVTLNWNRHQPSLAGINLQAPLIAENAVDLLLFRMQRNLFGLEEAAPTIHVPGTWMNGLSIRQPSSHVAHGADESDEVFAPALSRCE